MRYLILLFISPFLVNGQSLTKLSFDQIQDIDYFRSIKNRTNYAPTPSVRAMKSV